MAYLECMACVVNYKAFTAALIYLRKLSTVTSTTFQCILLQECVIDHEIHALSLRIFPTIQYYNYIARVIIFTNE